MATSTDLRSAIEEVQRSLPADQVQDGAAAPASGQTAIDRLARRVGALPWWVISATVHAVVFLLIALLAVAVPPPNVDEVIIATDVIKQKPPEYDPNKQRDIFKNTKDVQADTQVENPVVTHEPMEASDHFETDNNLDKRTSRGSEDAISDIPLGGTGTAGSVGVGGGGLAGVFGYRDGGGRKKAVGRWGGSEQTESSVEAALAWLARHQEKDGHWEGKKWEGTASDVTRGITGLAVLAFLGAGYTHKSGRYADNVGRAVGWIASKQEPSGEFPGRWGHSGYEHAICGLALAEAYGMTQDPKLREAAQKALDYSINVHQVPYSGWRYTPGEQPDMSVSGWFVMQLKSARVAGLKVDGKGFQGAAAFVDKMCRPDGWIRYHETEIGSRYGCLAIGMVCRQFLGVPPTDPLLQKQAGNLVTGVPSWPGTVWKSFYFWYYGTLGAFQQGGETWTKWNEALKKTLVPNQRKGGPLDGSAQDLDGSWDLFDDNDRAGSRVYTTAIGALCLEVYYRYLPMYAK